MGKYSIHLKGYSYSFRGLVQLESSRGHRRVPSPQCSADRRASRHRRVPQAIHLCSHKWILRAAVLTSLLNRRRRASWFGTAVCHSLEGRLCSHKWTLRAAALDSRSRRPPGTAVCQPRVAVALSELSPSQREKRPSGKGGWVIAPKPGQAPLSQRELARPDRSWPRSRLASEKAFCI